MVDARDYAVIIAVADYEHFGYGGVAEKMARLFYKWVTAPGGGGVPPEQVIAADRGTAEMIDHAFRDVCERGRGGRRLYIYMTGIGKRSGVDLFLFTAESSPERWVDRSAKHLAETADSYFSEVVLIADCVPKEVPFEPVSHAEESKRDGGFFHAFSISESPELTEAFIKGMSGEARDATGAVTGRSLYSYIQKPKRRVWFDVDVDMVLVPPPAPKEPPPPTPADRVTTHPDDPAIVDELGRRPFAEVLGKRIEEVRALQEKYENDLTFMIHLHGPWGSGKTSVLNFLKQYLEARDWVVVEFNAWRHQRMRPPWWALIQAIYSDAKKSEKTRGLAVKWWLWRFWADLMPALITIALFLVTFYLIVSGLQGPRDLEFVPKLLIAIAAACGAIWTYSRSLIFGSARAAQTYTELRSDPLAPIVELFRRLIKSIKRPVVVFIDDLDRCDSKYVIELLEGIQTLFRSASVTYVVAADRKWICSSFDETYERFGKSIGEPARPLGYLFLEKIFQVSASVPRLSDEVQGEYWKVLLRGDGVDPRVLDEQRQSAEKAADRAVSGAKTHEELGAKIAAEQRPLEKAAMRAAAAKQIVSPEARKETEHRLQPFARLLEPNPRAMKRLVNAYGLHQASHFLEGRDIPAPALARWTIVELRWPLLAEYLASRPEYAKTFATGVLCSDVPEALQHLFFDNDVRAAAGYAPPDAHVLDEAAIRRITGR
jgi:hypothetical protein